MHILSGKPFYVYITNLTARPANFLKFMIVTYAGSGPACIFPPRDDESYMLKNEGHIWTSTTIQVQILP